MACASRSATAKPRPAIDPRCDQRRRDAVDASRQRLRRDASAPSQPDLGAARRRRAPCQLHRRRPPPAAGDWSSLRCARSRRQRTILVTDAMAAAGCKPGHYRLGDVDIDVGADGRVSLRGTPYLAGSAVTMPEAVANTVRFTGLPLNEVLPMATTTPAEYIGISTAGTVTAEWDPVGFTLRDHGMSVVDRGPCSAGLPPSRLRFGGHAVAWRRLLAPRQEDPMTMPTLISRDPVA